jgi:hydrogenase nickel incorporation protein HypB
VAIEAGILEKNDRIAARNRALLWAKGIATINLMSSPGAGKTALLEKTARVMGPEIEIAVIEGDQETERDAERMRAAGVRALQINTGAGCHLDAAMVGRALGTLEPRDGSLLLVENVGNLVCPALFDLGEQAKVVIASVTEGEDKPLKYPHIFRAADVLVLNKIDLLPHLELDADRLVGHAERVNPQLRVFRVSATRGDGIDAWCEWLRAQVERAAGKSTAHT